MKIICVGCTGMLADCVRALADEGHDMILVARNPLRLAEEVGATAISMDWTDSQSVRDAVTGVEGADVLISWIHERGMSCLPYFEQLVNTGGRSIRIHGSSVGDSANGVKVDISVPDTIIRQHVVLGWQKEKDQKRWLTHAEISRGVFSVFSNAQQKSHMIGMVK